MRLGFRCDDNFQTDEVFTIDLTRENSSAQFLLVSQSLLFAAASGGGNMDMAQF